MKVEIIQGDILQTKADALINPANVTGYMGYGVAKAIVHKGGAEIEKEAVNKAPILIGDPIITTAGKLPFKAIIHTATIDNINDQLQKGTISKALLNALFVADEAEFLTVSVPGMGAGVGGVKPLIVAKAMLDAINAFNAKHIATVYLIDKSEEMVEAWQSLLNKKPIKKVAKKKR